MELTGLVDLLQGLGNEDANAGDHRRRRVTSTSDSEGFEIVAFNELGDDVGEFLVMHAEVQESRLPELDEVKDAVVADLKQERALERAREVAERVRSAAQSGGLERAASQNAVAPTNDG